MAQYFTEMLLIENWHLLTYIAFEVGKISKFSPAYCRLWSAVTCKGWHNTLILLTSAVFESLISSSFKRKTVKIKSQRYISPLKKDFYPITRNLDPIPKFCMISMRFHPMVKRGERIPLTINQPLFTWFKPFSYQANIYLFKLNKRKTRQRCDVILGRCQYSP